MDHVCNFYRGKVISRLLWLSFYHPALYLWARKKSQGDKDKCGAVLSLFSDSPLPSIWLYFTVINLKQLHTSLIRVNQTLPEAKLENLFRQKNKNQITRHRDERVHHYLYAPYCVPHMTVSTVLARNCLDSAGWPWVQWHRPLLSRGGSSVIGWPIKEWCGHSYPIRIFIHHEFGYWHILLRFYSCL